MDVVKDVHTAIFSGQTKCGKTHLVVLNLLESSTIDHFEYITVIMLPNPMLEQQLPD